MSLVRASSLSGLPALVRSLGGDPAAVLSAAGIQARDVGRHDVQVPLPRVAMAVEMAAVLTATPDFGRRLADRQGIDIIGPVGVAARTAATVADAITIFERFLAAYSPGLRVRLCDTGHPEQVFFEFLFLDRDLPPITQSVELSLGVTARILRLLIGARHRPVAVHLPHAPLTAISGYRDFYRCDPRFSSPTAGFALNRSDLASRLTHDQVTHQAIVDYLAGITRDTDTAADTVAVLVRQLLPTGTVTLQSVARRLRLHPKSLQRRLGEQHTSFTAIVDGIRRDRAERLLHESTMALPQLARELGYAEQSVLTRSCRRWFGCPPAAYRATHRRFGCEPACPAPGFPP